MANEYEFIFSSCQEIVFSSKRAKDETKQHFTIMYIYIHCIYEQIYKYIVYKTTVRIVRIVNVFIIQKH